MLVSVEKVNESAARYRAPSISKKERVATGGPASGRSLIVDEVETGPVTAPGRVTVNENLEMRKEMLASLDREPLDFAFERAIGKNDSVYSNFCEFIIRAKRMVGRIVIREGEATTGYATGFMVSDRLLLTNWHVFPSKEEVGESEVEFAFELDLFGHPIAPIIFKLAPDEFFYSYEQLDYCFVAVSPLDISRNVKLSSIGYHFLDPTIGKLGEEGKEVLNIIHHPGGDYQQLSIRENKFTKIQENTIWYETDTAQGSSGSPVFNDQWQVVALHHMGVPAMTADGKNFADKDGNPVLPFGGKIDATKIKWEANEGIRISVVLKDVFDKFPDNILLQGLKRPRDLNVIPETPPVRVAGPDEKKTEEREGQEMENDSSNGVRIFVPASLVEANGNVNININNRPAGAGMVPADQPKPLAGDESDAERLLAIEKLGIEDALTFLDCDGYLENFLGGIDPIPMPKPKPELSKFVAILKNGQPAILNYYFFSTIHHSVRKMPMISAINVDGNPELRKDKAKRKDNWLRDNRLDYDLQCGDDFYKSSHFDRGHMSRREDADYGTTDVLAKKHADMTCIYTNACPQVPAINQSSRHGLWGKLEEKVLEMGVSLEKGEFARICVFNGPIFSERDRFFRGVQIPMEFWKVIVWFNENKDLRATAFKLSQADLVGDIDFEKLGFDVDAEFRPFQCSIAALDKLTGLDFSGIQRYDTFKGADEDETFRVDSVETLKNIIVPNELPSQ